MLVVVALLSAFLTVVTQPSVQSASAADARLFDPGNLVSDAVFFDGGAMSSASVQDFLLSQVPNCSSSYACLTTFKQNTPNMAASVGRCDAYDGRPAESAADIITRVGQLCGISQKAMLVLLQKEQGLVTSASPTQVRFDHATGFGCPDTAACDSTVAGFFYQIYFAAKQFKTYATYPLSFNYRAGQDNSILFNPNSACGASTVFVVNQATAGLYNYTPYQPNAAAMANLYGIGDACSAYGNRNFFRIFSDWFGSPTAGTSLIRTSSSPNIWLISGTSKYLIPDASLLSSYSVLGQVAYVSQSVLDVYVTAQNASNIIRSPGGAIFFHDASIKLGMPSCALVVDYSGSCQTTGYTQLTDYQVNQFFNGPVLGNLFGTNTGGRYYIANAAKHEVFDDRSKTEASLNGSYPILTEGAISGLAFGAPVVRDSVFIGTKGGGAFAFYSAGKLHAVASGTESQYGIPQRLAGNLAPQSLANLPVGAAFDGNVISASETDVLSASTRTAWGAGLPALSTAPLTISAELLASYPVNSLTSGSYIKSTSAPAVYVVGPTDINAVTSWAGLVAFAGTAQPSISTLADSTVSQLAQGHLLLPPGSLVKAASSPAVYLVDGMGARFFLPSFDIASAAGIVGYSTVPDSELAAYASQAPALGYFVACGATRYLSAGGSIHALSDTFAAAFGVTPVRLDASTCWTLARGVAARPFIRTADGAVYLVSAGQKHLVVSMARFGELDPTVSNYLNVDSGLAASIPSGALA